MEEFPKLNLKDLLATGFPPTPLTLRPAQGTVSEIQQLAHLPGWRPIINAIHRQKK
jgi:hypothetical protein